MIDIPGWREILFQIKVWKAQTYFVYFVLFKLHSWGKRSSFWLARDFAPNKSLESTDILCVFRAFQTA